MLFVQCFFLLLIFANAFCFMLCLGLLTQFVYFKYEFPSCAVLMICWFFLILCSHNFLYESLCALWRNSTIVKLINHDCLPILMLLYIMLFIMLAYLMVLAALSNAVCFHNGFFSSFRY